MPSTMRFSKTDFDIADLEGGLDQLLPPLKRKPGLVTDGVNFECALQGGYTRVSGYERFDGRAKPSNAVYTIIQVASFTNTPSVGDILTGMTSGATGKIIALGADYMVLTLVTLTFTIETVKVGGTTIGVSVPVTAMISSLLNAQYLNFAADEYRALIGAVPGSGPVRGVFGYTIAGVHTVYALRDNVGATAVVLHKSTAGGWTAVSFYNEVSFTVGGPAVPADGNTLTQGANTATIKRVVLQSGSWASSTAAGRFIVTTPAPGNFGAGAATAGAVAVTLSGIQTAITLTPGGKFETEAGNFTGATSTFRVYGCDGVNRGFEFDGDVWVPIVTGYSTDAPKHLAIHKTHLFFSFTYSFANSAPGLPYNWQALSGAAEYAAGDLVTGFKVQPGDQSAPAMFVGCRNTCKILYGATALSEDNFMPLFNLVDFNPGIGCIDYSLQNMDRTYLFDDRGVVNMQAAQEYGNFLQATITSNIQTFITNKRSLFVTATLSKDKNQYRMFFSDGSGLNITLVNGKLIGMLPTITPNPVFCAWNGETASGNDVTYVGAATGGMVYELERGSSFDGANIDAYLTFSWNFMKSPRILKTFTQASLEIQGNFYAAFNWGYALGYRSPYIDQPTPLPYSSGFSGAAAWDSVIWDAFVWDGFTSAPTELEMEGTAENVQYTINVTQDYIYPFTINSIITHYTGRRVMR